MGNKDNVVILRKSPTKDMGISWESPKICGECVKGDVCANHGEDPCMAIEMLRALGIAEPREQIQMAKNLDSLFIYK